MTIESVPPLGSLVLYKKRPARVVQVEPRLEIELEDGNRAKVRVKDITLLHPGPLQSFKELIYLEGEFELTWQIMAEDPQSKVSLQELADLMFGAYTPATAWAAWKLLEDGLYFSGTPEEISANNTENVTRQQSSRQQHANEAKAWEAFLKRIETGQIDPLQDAAFIRDIEDLAYERRSNSRVLRALGRIERPENAHALLLNSTFWNPSINPYPTRLKIPTYSPGLLIPELADEPRLDLTHLQAFAIDDVLNQDPDDAISLDQIEVESYGFFQSGALWVHIADAACLVKPDSAPDQEARERGANLYLPEGIVTMLPEAIIPVLGLGINEISPALSFHIGVDSKGDTTCLGIHPSWVRVQRISYELAETFLTQDPLKSLNQISQVFQSRRQRNRAAMIDLPEVNIRVVSGKVEIRPLKQLNSRNLVREAMLMAGETAAKYAIQEGLPFPYATQEGSNHSEPPNFESLQLNGGEDMAGNYALRRKLKRSRVSSLPAPHAGVGLNAYSRVTSPLRRYLDLVVHQQLRAYLQGSPLINEREMVARIGMSEAITSSVSKAESLSRRHWTLVFLMQHPEWQGEAVLVERDGLRGRVLIPELALECLVYLREELPLNSRLQVLPEKVDLAELDVSLKIF